MATIDATTGLTTDQNNGGDASHEIFAKNLTQMLQDAQGVANKGTANLEAQKSGLEVSQAAMGGVSANNPLAFLYNMSSNSSKAGNYSGMGSIFEPGIASITGQENLANQNLQGFKDVLGAQQSQIQTQIAEYNAKKPVWTLSPVPNKDGDFYYYNTNTPAGQAPQTYVAGKVPPGVGGSPGGTPSSASDPTHLVDANNPYGIKMSSTNTDMFGPLGGTPGPAATDGGNFWSFPDITTGEKAARTLLTSNVYAGDSVDQALRQWSNYTGTGQYPGYNASILAGTGIDPNATIKSLTSNQIDVVLQKMKAAENVGGAGNTTSKYSPTSAPLDSSTAGTLAHNVAWGIGGITYDQGLAQLNAYPGGTTQYNKFIQDIKTENPNWNQALSNAYGQNVATASTVVKPAMDAANSVIGTIDANGHGSAGGALDLFDQMVGSSKTNAGFVNQLTGGIFGGTGYGVQEQNAFNRKIADIVSNVDTVLGAGGAGVVANNQTVDYLFPRDSNRNYTMTRESLIQALQQAQGFMDARYKSLTTNPLIGGTTGATTSGSSYKGIKLPN